MKIWIAVGVVAATVAGMALMWLIGGTNPMGTNRPGWECDSNPVGKICVKTAKPK